MTACLDQRNEGGALNVSLLSIKLLFTNGVDVLQIRELPFGIKWSVESMGKKEGGGILGK